MRIGGGDPSRGPWWSDRTLGTQVLLPSFLSSPPSSAHPFFLFLPEAGLKGREGGSREPRGWKALGGGYRRVLKPERLDQLLPMRAAGQEIGRYIKRIATHKAISPSPLPTKKRQREREKKNERKRERESIPLPPTQHSSDGRHKSIVDVSYEGEEKGSSGGGGGGECFV